jgi:anaerobic dimethyl sulfoxide reductase subunit A
MFVEKTPDLAAQIKDFDQFKQEGIKRISLPKPIVAFQEQIADIEKNPFSTPSGKIEIYSQRAAELNNPLCPPIPKYLGTPEDRNDPLREKYPLQLLTPHPRNRVHSELYKVDWLREVEPHRVWINPVDARVRGVNDGDEVQVFNDRGRVALPAWLTERIIPGVVSIFEGAWYAPDEQGIDRGACANTLTRDAYSPGGASVMNTALVEVRKA